MGKVFKFHNDVDTDQIIASQYLLFPSKKWLRTLSNLSMRISQPV